MKKISNICGFIGIAIYAVLMIRISNLCQYGGTNVDLIPILILGVVLIATIIFGIVSSRKEEKIENAPTTNAEGTPVLSPMQGTILRVDVAVGDHVKKGQILMILEAMKLENEILAAQDGIVKEIKVTKGQTVNSKQVLLILG